MADLRLPEGEHTIHATKTGYLSRSATIYLNALRGETVVLYLKPKTAARAALRNLLVPGWGSWYSDRRRVALGYLAAQTLIVGYAIYENNRFEDLHDDYNVALAEYRDAVAPAEIAAARAARDDAWDELSTSESRRDGAIWAAVIVQALAVADGYFRFPYSSAGGDRIAVVPEGGAGRGSLALRLRF